MYHENPLGAVSSGGASLEVAVGSGRRGRRRFEDSMSHAVFTRAYAQLLERALAAEKRTGFAPQNDGHSDGAWAERARAQGYTETEIEDLQELLRVRMYVTDDKPLASSVYYAMREAGVPTVVLGSGEHRRWVGRQVRRAARRRVGLGLLGLGTVVLAMSLGGADGGLASLVLGCTAVAGGLLLVR